MPCYVSPSLITLYFFIIFNLDRKRPGPPPGIPIPSKKSKNHAVSSQSSFAWEQSCIEVDAIDFVESLNNALQNMENEKVVSFKTSKCL